MVYPHKSNREVGDHIRAQIEPLLLQHKVDLTIAGHVHSYYRTCPVYDQQCTDEYGTLQAVPLSAPNATRPAPAAAAASSGAAGDGSLQRRRHGIVHFVIGSAGHKLSDIERDQSDWCAEAIQVWGYGRFTVKGSRSLLAEYVSSQTGEVLDSVELRAADAARGSLCRQEPALAAS